MFTILHWFWIFKVSSLSLSTIDVCRILAGIKVSNVRTERKSRQGHIPQRVTTSLTKLKFYKILKNCHQMIFFASNTKASAGNIYPCFWYIFYRNIYVHYKLIISRNWRFVVVSDRLLWQYLKEILPDILVMDPDVGVIWSCIWDKQRWMVQKMCFFCILELPIGIK